MEDSIYKALTDQTFELYQSFISSGFTAEQALELTKSQYAFANINYQTDYQRKRVDVESRRRVLEKFNKTREDLKKMSDGDSSCQE